MAGSVRSTQTTLPNIPTGCVRGAAFAASLLAVVALMGCTAEPTSQAPSSKGAKTSAGSPVSPGGNHPPIIRSARIYPVDVTLDSTLQVDLVSEDVESDPVTFRYQWFLNGSAVAGATSPSYSAAALKNKDRIMVEVTPNDGKVDGEVFKADQVTVGNTAPDIAEIHLEPVPLHRGDLLKVRVVAGDPEGDPIMFTYKWLRNDKEIAGPNGDTLDTKDFRKKDVLAVLVSVSDGKATRPPRAGRPVTIENAPPRFTSTPSAEVKDGLYEYAVVVMDPDEDPVTVELKQGPSGMTLDSTSGKLVWKLTPESKGKHRVVIVAKDNDKGVTEQEFELDGQLSQPAAAQP
jgi:hypothetical protein